MRFDETEILVRSRLALENIKPGAAIISISDDPNDYPELPNGCRISLRLHFHDIEMDIHDDMFEREPGQLVGKAFTADQAAEVAAFVKNLALTNIRKLVFQCEAGISRSAAMAAAVARYLRNDDMLYFQDYLPNRLVYRLTLQALWGHD